jgi:glucokinase
MILAGDIGGTKCNLALFVRQQGKLIRTSQHRFKSHDYQSLEMIIREFLAPSGGQPESAAFGVAGPVVGNQVRVTNLPWTVDGVALGELLGLANVPLFNDLEATGYGIGVLESSDLFLLNRGVPAPKANQVVLAAGTGLGEAVLFWDGEKHLVSATEGGHCDYAPRNDEEIELLRYLKKRYPGPAHLERILSGGGFRVLHEFLDPAVKHPSFDDPAADPAKEITGNAIAGSCPTCVHALNLWVATYGSEAGNLALKTLARGGVYVGGGIAPKIIEKLQDGTFVEAFCDKAKLRAILSQIPIYVILNDDCALLGAASRAAALLT